MKQKRRTQNEIMYDKSRDLRLTKNEVWKADGRGTCFSISLENKYHEKQSIYLGIFEDKKERDKWFKEWQLILKKHKNNEFTQLS